MLNQLGVKRIESVEDDTECQGDCYLILIRALVPSDYVGADLEKIDQYTTLKIRNTFDQCILEDTHALPFEGKYFEQLYIFSQTTGCTIPTKL